LLLSTRFIVVGLCDQHSKTVVDICCRDASTKTHTTGSIQKETEQKSTTTRRWYNFVVDASATTHGTSRSGWLFFHTCRRRHSWMDPIHESFPIETTIAIERTESFG
jgi:hypothetical protein